jgi:hypothetical protein
MLQPNWDLHIWWEELREILSMSCSLHIDTIWPKSELIPGEELMLLNIPSFIEFETNHFSSTILIKSLKA